MDPRQAAFFVSLFKPCVVIPMHYGTFPLIQADPEEFVKYLKEYAPTVKAKVLEPGDRLEIEE